MKKPKIYLSSSKAGDKRLTQAVREELSLYDVQIVEYTGGVYSNKPLDECDLLIIIPPDLNNYYPFTISTTVGRGQSDQIDFFNGRNILVLIDYSINYTKIGYTRFLASTPVSGYQSNWSDNYATLHLLEPQLSLSEALKDLNILPVKSLSANDIHTSFNEAINKATRNYVNKAYAEMVELEEKNKPMLATALFLN